jgi:hypothetical protein
VAHASDTLVFLGPTLPVAEARALLDAEYLPPARMGDVYRLLSHRVRRIVLIDGVFHGVPSVWHRELIDALVDGVEVIGASSMGALRAAELAPHGMRGIGEVFAWYRDGIIDGDDEVALVHGEADMAYKPLSMPLVNLRATLRLLETSGHISAGEHTALVDWLKDQPYPSRSVRSLAASPILSAWPASRAEAVLAAATDRFIDVKRDDAMAALAFAASTPPSGAVRMMPDADRTERAMWRIGRSLRGTLPSAGGRIAAQSLVSSLDAAERLALEHHLARRAFLVAWARLRGVEAPPASEPVDRDAAWLDARGLTAAAHDRLLAEQRLADWLCAAGAPAFGLTASANPADAFIADWARQHGVSIDGKDSDEALAQWMIEQGPAHFGLPFHNDAAIADHLRLAADLRVPIAIEERS